MKTKLFLLFTILSLSIASAQTFNVAGINYNIIPNTTNVEVGRNQYTLASVTIPSSVVYNTVTYAVTSIGKSAFEINNSLTSINIGNSVISIEERAFVNCSGLTSIIIPDSVTSIGELAFNGCRGLASVTIGNSLTSIGSGVFAYCTVLTSVTISNSVNTIGVSAFNGCVGLTSITIPNSVTTIGSNAFFGCTGLISITIPNSVTTIGNDAFYRCKGLTSVTIPNSVTTIGVQVFYDCIGLTTVNCAIDVPLAISAGLFNNVNQAACALNVPPASVNAYKAAAVWKNFNPINGTLSNDSFENKNTVKLYPNPVSNNLTIENPFSSNFQLQVINQSGQLILKQNNNKSSISLDVTTLSKGLYFLTVHSENDETQTVKFIKN